MKVLAKAPKSLAVTTMSPDSRSADARTGLGPVARVTTSSATPERSASSAASYIAEPTVRLPNSAMYSRMERMTVGVVDPFWVWPTMKYLPDTGPAVGGEDGEVLTVTETRSLIRSSPRTRWA